MRWNTTSNLILMDTFVLTWLLAWNKHINRGRDDRPFIIIWKCIFVTWCDWVYWLDVFCPQKNQKSLPLISPRSLMCVWSSSWLWGCHEQCSLLFSDLVNYYRKPHESCLDMKWSISLCFYVDWYLFWGYYTNHPLCHELKKIQLYVPLARQNNSSYAIVEKKQAVGGLT
jgi:hypothetical protein